MKGGVRFYLAGAVVLLALAGCGRSCLQYGERAAWRHQAEVACLKSGAVKIGAGVVQIQPIEGPGMCGADFPLKVAALGESSGHGYADELRPPGAIPNASAAQMPRWPVNEPRYAPAGAGAAGADRSRCRAQPVPGPATARATPGRRAISAAPQATAHARHATDAARAAAPAGRPMSIYRAGRARSPTIFPTTPSCRPAAPRRLSAHAAGL